MNDVTGMPQSVVVVGGTSDIARAILGELAARRMTRVLLAGRNVERLATAADELRTLGVGQVETFVADLASPEAMDSLVETSVEALGEIDLVLLASGALGTADLDELSPETVASLIGTNFTGPATAAVAFGRRLATQGHGTIVVLSSVAGYRVRRSNFVYGAAKAGLDGFAQGLGDAFAGEGVDVVIVRPGFIRTRMTAGRPPAPFAADAADVARAVVKGLEAGRRVIWVPEVLRPVFAIFRLLPQVLWRRLPM